MNSKYKRVMGALINSDCIHQIRKLKGVVLFLIMFFSYYSSDAQEIGYLSGVTKQGVNPQRFEPLYGFTIGTKINKLFAVETAFYYSQRSVGSTIQADYFSFLLLPKIGYFDEKFGFYYAPGIALNPTLYHSNIENHTYISTLQVIGGQFNIIPEIRMDAKFGYDLGLTGAYFENGIYQNYNGPVVMLGLKYVFK